MPRRVMYLLCVCAAIAWVAGVAPGCGDVTGAASSPTPSGATPSPTPSDRWWPLIQKAAEVNDVDALGLHRLMIAESDGQADLVSAGLFHGLYQYVPRTWAGAWNPWRAFDIYDGAAQIKATALAIRNGKGPYWWPNTYGPAFGVD